MATDRKVWVTSDLHLGHNALVDKRPKNYEELFFKNYSHVVREGDVVVFLGDIAFSKKAYWFQRIADLPGDKMLVMGNHDREKPMWYYKWGFKDVVPFGQSKVFRHALGNILLTHVPASESVLATYDSSRFMGLAKKHDREMDHSSSILNIHGHTHGSATETHRTVDVALEAIAYVPVLIDQVIQWKFR